MPSITHRNQILESENEILAAVAQGNPTSDVLNRIIVALEAISGDVIGSILELDKNKQQLRVLTAPNLPHAYNQSIDGIKIGDGVGSCGTAAYRGTPVVIEDVLNHPYWTEFKTIAEEHDLRACWSTPIISSNQEVLGTFACYYREPKLPSDPEWELMSRLGHLAAIVMERELSQRQLLEIREIDHAIVENAPDGVIVVTENGEIIKTNPKARELLGYDESDFSRIGYSGLLATDSPSPPSGSLFPFQQSESHYQFEKRLKTKSNAQLLAEMSATHLPDKRILILFRDITNRAHHVEHRAEGDKMQPLKLMASCITEELNQSLTSIMSHRDLLTTQLALHPEVSTICNETLGQILTAAEQAKQVTTQLANFCAPIPVKLESHESARFLSHVLLELRDELGPETDIQFHAAPKATTIYADAEQLKFALKQIIRAFDVKSTDEKKLVLTSQVNPTTSAANITLNVFLPRLASIEIQEIFEPFANQKSETLAAGLGFSAARNIITQMGGSIEVQREVPEALTFKITLPSSDKKDEPASPPPQKQRKALQQAHESVLVCEDNEAIRLAVDGLLRASGYTVHLAANGAEALEIANRPDTNIAVLISDIRMPGISGKELATKIREHLSNIQIILISGHTGGLVSEDWLEKERIKFLPKPFTHATLIEAVSEAFSSYRLLKSS